MRIELQLVEFERGTCAVIPVAASPGSPTLFKQLVISRFAIPLHEGLTEKRRVVWRPGRHPQNRLVCHNGSQQLAASGQKVSLNHQSRAIPITVAEHVTFEVPIHLAN